MMYSKRHRALCYQPWMGLTVWGCGVFMAAILLYLQKDPAFALLSIFSGIWLGILISQILPDGEDGKMIDYPR